MGDDLQLVEQRHAWLLERVTTQRRVMTAEAAAQLDVSVDTIRRDLRHLHDRGLVKRVHGGAIPVARLPNSFAGRTQESSESTAALAARIVERFRPGHVIGLDGGTTCVEIAAMIPATLEVTVITNNPAAAVALGGHENTSVILLGGQLDLTWMATVGADAVDAWRNYRLDIGVLGLCGLDSETGATTYSASEVATKRALIESSTDVVVPVTNTKIGVRAPYVIGGLDALDIVITDAALPLDLAQAFAGDRHSVVIADDQSRTAGS